MRISLAASGWRIASLHADWLLVERRADLDQPDLDQTQAHVRRDTGFRINLKLKTTELTEEHWEELGKPPRSSQGGLGWMQTLQEMGLMRASPLKQRRPGNGRPPPGPF